MAQEERARAAEARARAAERDLLDAKAEQEARAKAAEAKARAAEEELKAELAAQTEEAAKCANAHGFISGFDEGYEKQLGAGGLGLSGGQKQRVAIARALRKRPVMLILDAV